MAFCGNCGATVSEGAQFCGSCGKAVDSVTTDFASSPQGSSAGGARKGAIDGPGLASNLVAALAYLLGFITGIVFLVVEPYKKDRFVRFHAMQSILFSAACVVFSIAWRIVWGILFAISGYLALLALPLRLLISVGLFLYWLFLMYQAYSRREYRIPFVGAMAAKQVG